METREFVGEGGGGLTIFEFFMKPFSATYIYILTMVATKVIIIYTLDEKYGHHIYK